MAKPDPDMRMRPGYEQRRDARTDPRLDWWREARFGLFIHWGLYAMDPARWSDYPVTVTHHYTGEWVQHVRRVPHELYARSAGEFNPVGFDADEWVACAREAGMRYVVLTAKHHDGFCLFDSTVTDFNIVRASPFGRDIVAELADACRRAEMPFGLYYSQTQDWSCPDAVGNDWDFDPAEADFARYLDGIVRPHLEELLTRYGPIGLIWFDTPMIMTPEQSRGLVDLVHSLQPACLASGRIGNGLGDYASFRDNRFPAAREDMDWESPATMNRTWGFVANDRAWKSPRELLWTLIDATSKGGNLLLNVGPDAFGRIPDASVQILKQMGTWLAANGEAIYATTAGPVQDHSRVRTTARGEAAYVTVITWPRHGRLALPAGALPPSATATVLATRQELPVQQEGAQAAIQLPPELLPTLPVALRL